jgi:hypothetical protein
MSKKKSKPLPRDEWVQCITRPNEKGEIEFTFDDFGDLHSVSNMEPDSASHSRSYRGLNREKQLSLINGGNALSFSQERFLCENYERIYFIDTNDSKFNDKKSCCTAVYELKRHKEALLNPTGIDRVYIKYLIGYYQIEVSESISGEKIGWHLFLEATRKFFESFPNGTKILLVTDHELGEHRNINSRKKPYYLDFYLPSNVELGYAKSDKSGSFLEFAMRKTDQMSNIIKEDFKKYENSKLIIQTLNYDSNFRGFATINPNRKSV